MEKRLERIYNEIDYRFGMLEWDKDMGIGFISELYYANLITEEEEEALNNFILEY